MTEFVTSNAVFGPGGALAEKLPNYTPRPGQVALANEVQKALEDKAVLLAEAPTGTGKSLAYSIPAGIYAMTQNKRVVIATANITLQEQLYTKDLPFVSSILPRRESGKPLTFTLLKGVGNYICKRRFHKRVAQMNEGIGPYASELSAVIDWEKVTHSGDKSELERTPPPALWNDINGSHDAGCLGRRCPHIKSCYIKGRNLEVDILICNYHILFTHIMLGIESGTGVLPEFHVLIMDEAHEAPGIAMDFYGWQLTERALTQACRKASDVGAGALRQIIVEGAHSLFEELGNRMKHSSILQNRVRGVEETTEALYQLGKAYGGKAEELKMEADAAFEDKENELGIGIMEEYQQYARYARLCHKHCAELHSISDKFPGEHRVYSMARKDWSDKDSPVELMCKVVETGPFFSEYVFSEPPVISMSATLTAGHNFNFISRRFGLSKSDYRAVISPSPFDPGNVLVYVPDGGFPEPSGGDDHARAVTDVIYDVASRIGGRTLGLFTSYRNLNTAKKMLRERWAHKNSDVQVFVQGELPQMRIIAEFVKAEKAVILATASFWKGIDIPGRDLSCVIIDKIPFARPDDPVLYYLENYEDEQAFLSYSVPQAIITLKQGMGRLIRRESDYGAIGIMDPRINYKGYGKRVKSSFPDDCWLTDEWQDVVDYIQEMDTGGEDV